MFGNKNKENIVECTEVVLQEICTKERKRSKKAKEEILDWTKKDTQIFKENM